MGITSAVGHAHLSSRQMQQETGILKIVKNVQWRILSLVHFQLSFVLVNGTVNEQK